MFKNTKDILKNILIKTKEDDNIQELKKIWKKTISKKVQHKTTIIDLQNKTLILKAKNPTWKTELVFSKDLIKKKLTNKKPT